MGCRLVGKPRPEDIDKLDLATSELVRARSMLQYLYDDGGTLAETLDPTVVAELESKVSTIVRNVAASFVDWDFTALRVAEVKRRDDEAAEVARKAIEELNQPVQ